MVWASVWCCCTEPVKAASGKHERTCCAEDQPAKPDHCPPNQADCPIIKAREQSQQATPLVLPSFEPTLAWLPIVQHSLIQPAQVAVRFERHNAADPPLPAPTLVALHTSLLW